jgi:hypothetical protein
LRLHRQHVVARAAVESALKKPTKRAATRSVFECQDIPAVTADQPVLGIPVKASAASAFDRERVVAAFAKDEVTSDGIGTRPRCRRDDTIVAGAGED